MALAHSTTDDAFTEQVATNIRTVLQLRRMTAGQAAERIGLTRQVFSQRMTGSSRWLAVDIDRLARALDVAPGVILAHDETEFRKQLASGYNHDYALHHLDEEQGELWDRHLTTPYNAQADLLAI